MGVSRRSSRSECPEQGLPRTRGGRSYLSASGISSRRSSPHAGGPATTARTGTVQRLPHMRGGHPYSRAASWAIRGLPYKGRGVSFWIMMTTRQTSSPHAWGSFPRRRSQDHPGGVFLTHVEVCRGSSRSERPEQTLPRPRASVGRLLVSWMSAPRALEAVRCAIPASRRACPAGGTSSAASSEKRPSPPQDMSKIHY